jgi:alpha-ribazole phosphatase
MADYLYLVRHGSTGSSRDGRYLGRTDLPLDAGGRPQVEALAELLRAKRRCGRCVCSPLRRAAQTAEILRSATGCVPELDADLREIDFGRWEGKTFSEIRDSSPEEVARWAQFAPDFAFPGGESLRGFLDRVGRAADRLAGEEAETVLAVTHGGVIKAMLCRLLGLDPSRYVVFEIPPASLTVVRLFEGKGVLSEMIRVEPPEPK